MTQRGLAHITLLGDPEAVSNEAKKLGLDISKCTIHDPVVSAAIYEAKLAAQEKAQEAARAAAAAAAAELAAGSGDAAAAAVAASAAAAAAVSGLAAGLEAGAGGHSGSAGSASAAGSASQERERSPEPAWHKSMQEEQPFPPPPATLDTFGLQIADDAPPLLRRGYVRSPSPMPPLHPVVRAL